jgi:hypothetical protein
MSESRGELQFRFGGLPIASFLVIVVELMLGLALVDQILSRPPISFHRATELFLLICSLIVAPLPWLAFRKGYESIRRKLFGLGVGDDCISIVGASMASLLVTSYAAIMVLAMTLAHRS